jgi:amidohydrolase
MHACGHDVHAAWTIGAAHLLAQSPAEGDVLIVLQPAEETGRGALSILETGLLKRVKAIFGAHVDRHYEVGKVIVQEGPLAASADNFFVTLHGQGAHGARPHEAVDPIVGIGALITSLQTVVSRRMSPSEPAVLTVGTVNAGSAPNIIPDRALLAGTIRAVSETGRKTLQAAVREISVSVASAFRLKADVTIEEGPPPIVNPSRAVGWARESARRILGEEAIVPLRSANLAGEDFAFYMETIEGCFLRIGAREKGGKPIPAHSPQFYADEESIFVGAALLAETARVASASLTQG